MSVSKLLGMAAGVAALPAASVATILLRKRLFHGVGRHYRATVTPLATDGASGKVARRLAGEALIRVSGGLPFALDDTRRDVLGFAMRFHEAGTPGHQPGPGDQDLVMASFKTLPTIAKGFATSDTRHVLHNTFRTAQVYTDVDLGRVEFRVLPERQIGEGDNGFDRLDHVVSNGGASMVFAWRPWSEPDAWTDLLELKLVQTLDHADDATHFDPFRSGRGIEPAGFWGGLRKVVYPVARRLRGG